MSIDASGNAQLSSAAQVRRRIAASPEQVWAVISDGWLYPAWVVGASRMRDVDGHWPERGSQLHHSVGAWPGLIDDVTEVVAMDPARHIELIARAWPTGQAIVEVRLDAVGSECEVSMREDADSGPATLIPHPVRQALLTARNKESLARLALIAEHRR